MLNISNELKKNGLRAGIVTARGIVPKPAPDGLVAELGALVQRRRAEDFPPAELKKAVRDLLRSGGFKPSGRNKPASEYLAQAAREDRFPYISNLVDINNYISLESGLPVSLLDLEAVGESVLIRCGRPGEQYVFNSSGQEIDLEGLIVVCRAEPDPGQPLGTPVKDSMAGKVKENTDDVVGIIYAPQDLVGDDRLEQLLDIFAKLLEKYAGASQTEKRLV